MNSFELHWTSDRDLLERFVLNRLEAAERDRLEAHLSSCNECQDSVRMERELIAGIRRTGRDEMKSKLKNHMRREESPALRWQQIGSIVAAALIVAVGFGVYRLWFYSPPSPATSQREIVLKSQPLDSLARASASSAETKPRQGETSHQPFAENEPTTGNGSVSNQALSETSGAGNEVASGNGSASVWILGTIIIDHENYAADENPSIEKHGYEGNAKTEESKKDEGTSVLGSKMKKFKIRKGDQFTTITIRQAPLNASTDSHLMRQQAQTVKTLLERTADGLHLTLFSDASSLSNLKNATLEPVPPDSLIVHVGNVTISYHIPGGWGVQ